MFLRNQVRAMDRLFENMMREFNAPTPLKAVEAAFPKEGATVRMGKWVGQDYVYKKCESCGTLHLVEAEASKGDPEKSES